MQILRDFRDLYAQGTYAGSQFMQVFNGFYYSFSPAVAEFISTTDAGRSVARGLLFPLIQSLEVAYVVYDLFHYSSELAVILAGLSASFLIGLTYAMPLVAVTLAKAEDGKKRQGRSLKPLIYVWIGSLVVLGISEVLFFYLRETVVSSFLAMVSSGTLVLSTMILAPLLLLRLIRRLIH